MSKKITAWLEVPVGEAKILEYGSIHCILIDGRIQMIAQWRPCDGSEAGNGVGQWWTLGMSQATHIESKKKCVTHFLSRQTIEIV